MSDAFSLIAAARRGIKWLTFAPVVGEVMGKVYLKERVDLKVYFKWRLNYFRAEGFSRGIGNMALNVLLKL